MNRSFHHTYMYYIPNQQVVVTTTSVVETDIDAFVGIWFYFSSVETKKIILLNIEKTHNKLQKHKHTHI